MNKIDWRIVCAGLLAITVLEVVALLKGINGALLSLVLVIIAGAIGVSIPTPKIFERR